MAWLIEAYQGQSTTEIVLDEAVLQEMHFSKKDLQDPKTLDKIIKGKERFETAGKYFLTVASICSLLLPIALGIVLHSFIAVPIALALLFTGLIKLILLVDELPLRWYKENEHKYKMMVFDFKKKTEAAMEKTDDPKKKEKYKQIIDNCDAVIAEFRKRDAEKLSKEKEAMIEDARKLIEDTVRWYNDPGKYLPYGHTGSSSEGELALLLFFLKVPENKIIDHICKKCKDKSMLGKEFLTDFYGVDNDEIEMPEYKPILNDHVIEFSSDDEYCTLISIEKKKCYFVCIHDVGTESITKYVKKTGDVDPSGEYKKALIEADKELGYYLFSKCPDGVKQKEWPIKL